MERLKTLNLIGHRVPDAPPPPWEEAPPPPSRASSTRCAIICATMGSGPMASATAQGAPPWRSDASRVSSGRSCVTCRPGARKKGATTTERAPRRTQRPKASSIEGSASSMCATSTIGPFPASRRRAPHRPPSPSPPPRPPPAGPPLGPTWAPPGGGRGPERLPREKQNFAQLFRSCDVQA